MIYVVWFFSLLFAGCAGFFVCCLLVVSQRKPHFQSIPDLEIAPQPGDEGYDPQQKYCPAIDSIVPAYRIIRGTTKGGDPYRHATIDELTG